MVGLLGIVIRIWEGQGWRQNKFRLDVDLASSSLSKRVFVLAKSSSTKVNHDSIFSTRIK